MFFYAWRKIVCSKKVLKCLFLLSLTTAVLLPSDSWGMDGGNGSNKRPRSDNDPTLPNKKQKIETPTETMPPTTAQIEPERSVPRLSDLRKGMRPDEPVQSDKRQMIETPTDSFLSLPFDLIYLIVANHLPVHYRARMEEVCKTFNAVPWWKMRGGLKNGEEALPILNQLFDQTPRLKALFSGEHPLAFPYKIFNTDPSNAALKCSYISQHMLTYKGMEAAKKHLEKAAEYGDPGAAWKLLKASSKKPSEQFSREKKINFDFEFLQLALGGCRKAIPEVIKRMLNTLAWRGSDIPTTPLPGSFFPSQFSLFVQLLKLWPEGREDFLGKAFPKGQIFLSENSFSKLVSIGEEKPVELSFEYNGNVPLQVTWPEAFSFIAKKSLEAMKDSPDLESKSLYFKTACDAFFKDNLGDHAEAGHLLAQTLPYEPIYIHSLKNTSEKFPRSSGTAIAKIACIKLQQLASFDLQHDPLLVEELVEDAYQKILMNSSSPFSARDADKRRNQLFREEIKVTKASDLIDTIIHRLTHQPGISLEIKERFLDWAMTKPQYLYTTGVSHIIFEYLTKWGDTLFQSGKFTVTNQKPWTDKDTKYALEYFQFRPSFPSNRGASRGFYMSLMGLKQDDDKIFVRCFKEYCGTYAPGRSNDKLTKTNREALQRKLDAFLQPPRKNAELPLLFAKLPLGPGAFEKQLKSKYLKIAAENGSAEALEYFKAEASKGVAEAEDFIESLTLDTAAGTLLSFNPPIEEKPKVQVNKTLPRKPLKPKNSEGGEKKPVRRAPRNNKKTDKEDD